MCIRDRGIGVSFFLEEIVRERSDITARPLSDPLYLEVGLAWNQNRYLSKTARTFIETFRGSIEVAK
jgi:DNA-binding transcriptional LysR family regulator